MGMAERIKERRTAMGLTQEELGEKLGLQKSAIAKYENGRVENIKRSIILDMAKALNCSPSYLMGWEPDGNPISYDIEFPDGIHVQISGKEHQKDLMKRITAYMELLDVNRKKADDYIDTLLSVQNMEDELALAAAHKRTDIETTAEMHQHDDDIMNDDSEWE